MFIDFRLHDSMTLWLYAFNHWNVIKKTFFWGGGLTKYGALWWRGVGVWPIMVLYGGGGRGGGQKLWWAERVSAVTGGVRSVSRDPVRKLIGSKVWHPHLAGERKNPLFLRCFWIPGQFTNGWNCTRGRDNLESVIQTSDIAAFHGVLGIFYLTIILLIASATLTSSFLTLMATGVEREENTVGDVTVSNFSTSFCFCFI